MEEPSYDRVTLSNGAEVAYVTLGYGPALICLHGGGPGASGWSNYQRNVAALAASFRVYLVDLPGFGESPALRIEGDRYQFFAETVTGLLRKLDVEQADIIGNSMGGRVALEIALTDPSFLRRLVLMGPGGSFAPFSVWPTHAIRLLLEFYNNGTPTRARVEEFLRQMVFDQSLITDELVEERFRASTRPDVLANPPTIQNVPSKFPIWSRLPTLPHEVLLIWGREDRVVPWDSAFPMVNMLPNCRLHVFTRCGHWAQWEHPEEFNELVLSFLKNGG
jgi:2-hydroxy-6-oxonona-2,4-dienedioate hydrolase/4,5:9,10-diseco-3-hydroxy-5,9,17-trioxoandrosta-1(10),2-diene-4-oate hydrolase